MGDRVEYSLDAPLRPQGRRRRRPLPVRGRGGLVRADRVVARGAGPGQRHPGPARHRVRPRRPRPGHRRLHGPGPRRPRLGRGVVPRGRLGPVRPHRRRAARRRRQVRSRPWSSGSSTTWWSSAWWSPSSSCSWARSGRWSGGGGRGARRRSEAWAVGAERRLDALGRKVERPRRVDETATAYAVALAQRYRDDRGSPPSARVVDRALYATVEPQAPSGPRPTPCSTRSCGAPVPEQEAHPVLSG